jgi:site-specific DNA recombinase
MNPTTKLVALYARVSTSNQENEGTIETQILSVNEFAKKNNFTIVQEYTDNGWSGDTLVRPALDQLRMDAKDKNWEAVVIYDPDRLARRGAWQEVVMEELKELEIEVLFVTIPPPKTDEDLIMYKMRGVFTEYERMKIKERFRIGKLRKVKDGHLLVSEALYGYTYILKKEKEHGYYEINESEARVVRMIFSWVGNDGMTLRAVVRKLQELGIKPRRSKRGVWNTSTLSTMLRHKGYIGMAHWGSSYAVVPTNPTKNEKYKKTKKSSRKNKPESEWIASEIPIPKIINEQLFEKARAQLESNFALCERNTKNEYLLSKKIWCECGRTRAGEGPQHGKHLYYRCTDRVMSFPLPRTCELGGINARIADKMVWDKISNIMSSPKLMMSQVERWMNNQKSKVEFSGRDITVIEKELSKLKEQEDRYNKAYGMGIYTVEELVKYTNPIKENRKSLDSEIVKINYQKSQINATIIPNQDYIESFAEQASSMLKNLSFEIKRSIILNVVDKITATQEKLQVCGYIPITIENNVAFFPKHRNCRTAKCREVDVV